MAFGNFLGNPAVAGALSLGAGLAQGAAKERQTQMDYRRKMAELSHRQKLGMQDYEMKQAYDTLHPGPGDRARLTSEKNAAQEGIAEDQQYISERGGSGGARTNTVPNPGIQLGPQEGAASTAPPLTSLISAIRNDRLDPNAAFDVLRNYYWDDPDWSAVEKEIKEKRKELKADREAAQKPPKAGIRVKPWTPPVYTETPDQYLPGKGASTGGLPGSGGDPADPASMGNTEFTLPDGSAISSAQLDNMTTEQIMALRGGGGQSGGGQNYQGQFMGQF
jgi:hypothetical protein